MKSEIVEWTIHYIYISILTLVVWYDSMIVGNKRRKDLYHVIKLQQATYCM